MDRGKPGSCRRNLPLFAAALLLACAAGFKAEAAAQAASSTGVVRLHGTHGGTTAWHLNRSVLQPLGIRVIAVRDGLPPPASTKQGSYRRLLFGARENSGLRFRESDGLPRAFDSGALQHSGGFVLEFPGGSADLRDFSLQPNARAPFALDVVGGDGYTWFILERGTYQLEDANRMLALRYMNLRMSAYFAQRLGRPEFSELSLGGVDSVTRLDALDATGITNGLCSAPWPGESGAQADIHMVYQAQDAESGAPDSIHFRRCGLPDAGGVYQDATCTATSVDRGVVFAPDTSLLNAGTATVSWHKMFSAPSPPYGNDQHPMLIWNLYRVAADGSLRQLAASGVKHAFNTINKTCGCSDHANSYPGCEDSYSQTSNDIDAQATPNYLGPRSEIVPAAGVWGRCQSVFDKDCDGNQDGDAGAQNDFQYRLIVRENEITASLQPGAQFYFEYWYVVRGQANIYNAMGHRPLTFSKLLASDGSYLWDVVPGAFVNGPVINRWVNPASPPAGTLNSELITPEGRVRIAVRTRALGGGVYRYDYAVMNLDFARGVIDPAHASEPDLHLLSADGFSALTIPVDAAVTLGNIVFNDADTDASNDWTMTRDAAGLHWQAPVGHPLNWGTLYRFSFDANHAPLAGSARLSVATTGTAASYAANALAPIDDAIFRDDFEGN